MRAGSVTMGAPIVGGRRTADRGGSEDSTMTGRRLHPTRTAPAEGFGRRLRRLREQAGLSQVALAGEALHPSYVSQLESGRRAPTDAVVAVLATRLHVPVDDLLGDSPDDDTDLAGAVALAEAALGLGRPDEARALLEPEAERITPAAVAGAVLVHRLAAAYATSLERLGRLDDAIRLLELMRDAAELRGSAPTTELLVALMRCSRDAGDLARAIDVGESARARLNGRPSADLAVHAELVSTLAGVYSERGDVVRAAVLLEELMHHTDREGTLEQQASAYWNAAITAVERGRADEGLLLCDQAALLVQLTADLRSQARLAVTQAWVLLAQSPPRAHEARELLRAALPRLRQHDSGLSVASAETELARSELMLGRPEVAARVARSSLRRLSPDHRVERARAVAVLGEALQATGDLEAGLVALDESAVLLAEAGAGRESAAAWRHLSDVHLASGDTLRALTAAQHALDCLGVRARTGQGSGGDTPAAGPRATAARYPSR
jgi:transcriptional regulator with XRE-family HTH domain